MLVFLGTHARVIVVYQLGQDPNICFNAACVESTIIRFMDHSIVKQKNDIYIDSFFSS